MWDMIVTAIMDWCLSFAPRPIRIGCTVLLIAALVGLLAWVLLQ
jgi:hypothetical protein